jgi:hypothetical protein
MTLPANESLRQPASWRGLFDLASRVCDRYGLPNPSLSFGELWVNFFYVAKGERWLFI